MYRYNETDQRLVEAPEILAELATVEMRAIHTSGNCQIAFHTLPQRLIPTKTLGKSRIFAGSTVPCRVSM